MCRLIIVDLAKGYNRKFEVNGNIFWFKITPWYVYVMVRDKNVRVAKSSIGLTDKMRPSEVRTLLAETFKDE